MDYFKHIMCIQDAISREVLETSVVGIIWLGPTWFLTKKIGRKKKTKNMVIKRVPLEPTSHHMVSRFYTGLKLCHFKRETPTGIHVLHVKNWYDML